MTRGRLITIEGIDGAGKTTLAIGLLDALAARGIEIGLLREPGGVAAAERIRELVIDPDLHVTARAEALLYAAARAQLVEEAIEPQLAAGTVAAPRPLYRLLARLPGRWPTAGDRCGPGYQRVRDPDGSARPHPAADDRPAPRAQSLARTRGNARPPRARAGRLLRAHHGRVSRARLAGARADPPDRRLAGAR